MFFVNFKHYIVNQLILTSQILCNKIKFTSRKVFLLKIVANVPFQRTMADAKIPHIIIRPLRLRYSALPGIQNNIILYYCFKIEPQKYQNGTPVAEPRPINNKYALCMPSRALRKWKSILR